MKWMITTEWHRSENLKCAVEGDGEEGYGEKGD
jgi:hypothetical protein